MRRDIFIFCGGGVMTALGVEFGPQAPIWDFVLCGGIAGMVLSALDGFLLKIGATGGYKLLAHGAVAACLAGIAAYIYIPRYNDLPGFSSFVFVRLYDTPEPRRKYLFDFVAPTGSGASAFISSSDVFTFSITDIHNEPYDLEIPLSDNKIPIDRFIFLACDVGITDNHTIMRVLVDGKTIGMRSLELPVDFGPDYWKWSKAILLADRNGTNNAPFTVALWGVAHQTLSNARLARIQFHFDKYLTSINSSIRPRNDN